MSQLPGDGKICIPPDWSHRTESDYIAMYICMTSRDGYGNGIQDLYPRDGVGKRESRIRGDDWGFPAGADATERFPMVRIASSITELRFWTGVQLQRGLQASR